MALCRNWNRWNFNSLWYPLLCKLQQRLYYDVNGTSAIEIDAVDDFTTQLVQRKAEKWLSYNEKKKVLETKFLPSSEKLQLNIKHLNIQQLNSLVIENIETDSLEAVLDIFEQCRKFKILPSLNVVLRSLTFIAQKGDKESILIIKDICKDIDPDILEPNSNFDYFIAEALWMKGNIAEAINLLENVYQTNVYLRRRIRLMLKYLINDGVSNRSEAILHNIINFCETLAKSYNDYYPMVLVWQSCILSEWFSDQCTALELLRKHDSLCSKVTEILPFVATTLLCKDRAEVVYRLLEVFLSKEKQPQSYRILVTLFDDKLRKGDIRGCSEIIQWTMENGVDLPLIQQEKFIHVLIKYSGKQPLVLKKNKAKDKTKSLFNLQF